MNKAEREELIERLRALLKDVRWAEGHEPQHWSAITQAAEALEEGDSAPGASRAAAPDLLAALQELHLKTVVGTDAERHAALDQAWAAISKALASEPSVGGEGS